MNYDDFMPKSTFQYTMTVRMRDIDPYGIVNNSEYFSFFEAARIDAVRRLDLSVQDFLDSFVLCSVDCKFVNSLTLMDTALVTTVIQLYNKESMALEFKQQISNQNNLLIAKADSEYQLK